MLMRALHVHRGGGWRRAPRPRLLLRAPRRGLKLSPNQEAHLRDNDLLGLTAKWQRTWDRLTPEWSTLGGLKHKEAYILPMFPYPSGTLHLGHLRVYTIADVLARFKHLDGFRVLHPIGWDAFGLPAENAALERGVQPGAWTRQNIAAMKAQMRAMGGQWDWDRELRTCDPAVYQHTQRLFLLLHARGLAYQAEALVNYDPVDKTVLANEQVDAHGCSWRSGAKVEKLLLKQWFLKIKHFQDALLHDLDALAESGRWPERVISMQRNWIGRSEGMKLCFDIQTGDAGESQHDPLEVFTTRADTLFGVHYVALSLHHPLVQAAAKHDDALKAFRQRAHHLPPDSKEGYLLPNLQAINPLFDVSRSEDGGRLVPIYVAPYVLEDYGSGAVMGVPGHDTRDHAFWRANTDARPIRTVITTEPGVSSGSLIPGQDGDRPVTAKGFMATDIDGFADLPSDEAAQRIASRLQQSGKPVEKTVNWRLRDWLISRQRYWGTPIPIIHCNTCGPVPVPVADLPVELPQLPDASFRGRTGNPLADDETWKKTTCPKCGEAAERETDTMDTFMDSSWYFFRFLDPQNSTSLVSPDKANRGMPVDVYVGGVEHAILHLLYARFISKFLATTPLWPAGRLVHGEPFKHLLTQGMVHGKTYSDPDTRRFLRPEEVDLTNPSAPTMRPHGQPCTVSFEKMSKSKHNGVDPGETIARYGADVTRAHMLFQAPVSAVLEWDETSITGVQRWLVRVIRLSKATFVTPEDHSRGFRPPKNIDMSLTDLLWWLHEEGLIKHKMSMDQDFNTLKLAWVQKLPDGERYLWGQLQNIITSVRQSYSETHSLNTVVSHLMTLTNIIWDTAHTSLHVAYLKWFATVHLLRMVAPIAPAVAEEGWKNIHTATSARINQIVDHPLRDCGRPSVFAFGFPIADGNTSSKLRLFTTCVFQINGKKRFEVNIRHIPDFVSNTDGPELAKKVLEAIVATDTGSEWLEVGTGKLWKAFETSEPHPFYGLIPKDFKLIVVKRGQVVNVVSPNISKEDRKKAREEKMAQRRAKKQVSEKLQVPAETPQRVEEAETVPEEPPQLLKKAITQLTEPAMDPPRATVLPSPRLKSLMESLPRQLRPTYLTHTVYPIHGSALVRLHDLGLTVPNPSYRPAVYSGPPTPIPSSETHPVLLNPGSVVVPTPPAIPAWHISRSKRLKHKTRDLLAKKHKAVFPEQVLGRGPPVGTLYQYQVDGLKTQIMYMRRGVSSKEVDVLRQLREVVTTWREIMREWGKGVEGNEGEDKGGVGEGVVRKV